MKSLTSHASPRVSGWFQEEILASAAILAFRMQSRPPARSGPCVLLLCHLLPCSPGWHPVLDCWVFPTGILSVTTGGLLMQTVVSWALSVAWDSLGYKPQSLEDLQTFVSWNLTTFAASSSTAHLWLLSWGSLCPSNVQHILSPQDLCPCSSFCLDILPSDASMLSHVLPLFLLFFMALEHALRRCSVNTY